MKYVGNILLTLLVGSIGSSIVVGLTSQYSSYLPPTKDSYKLPAALKDTDPVGTEEVPSNNDNGFDSLRQFSTSLDSTFIQRRLFNTSVALTIPLFSFTLPQRATSGSSVDLANQAIFGLFSLLVVVLVFAVPILFTGSRPSGLTGKSNERNGILNNLMSSNKVFNFMGADMTNNIGLDPEKCLQKTICEAHKYPKKYGMMATPFQIFFPPPSSGKAESRATSYQLAAKSGKEMKDCGKAYKCFFDMLDLLDYFVDWWKYTTAPQYVIEA